MWTRHRPGVVPIRPRGSVRPLSFFQRLPQLLVFGFVDLAVGQTASDDGFCFSVFIVMGMVVMSAAVPSPVITPVSAQLKNETADQHDEQKEEEPTERPKPITAAPPHGEIPLYFGFTLEYTRHLSQNDQRRVQLDRLVADFCGNGGGRLCLSCCITGAKLNLLTGLPLFANLAMITIIIIDNCTSLRRQAYGAEKRFHSLSLSPLVFGVLVRRRSRTGGDAG